MSTTTGPSPDSHHIDWRLIIVGALPFLSRLPFLGAGYGTDSDAWRVAVAAKTISETKKYVYSRPPGFPIHEIVSSLLIHWGPWALNGALAVMSVVAVVYFVLVLRRMGIKNAE